MQRIFRMSINFCFRHRIILWKITRYFPCGKKLLRNIFHQYFSEKRDYTKIIPTRGPSSCELNISSHCNLSCIFCEIHHYLEKQKTDKADVQAYYVDRSIIEKLDDLFSSVQFLSVGSSIGEPLCNPHFPELIAYLAEKHPHLHILMTSNGTLLTEKICDNILKCDNINSIFCSVSAGDEDTYKQMHGNNYFLIQKNIQSFIQKRNALKKRSPKIGFNFILSRLNGESLSNLILLAKKWNVEEVHLIHYLQVRNLLSNEVSYYNKPAEVNRIIINAYSLANKAGISMIPPCPELLTEINIAVNNSQSQFCTRPWENFQISPCLECKNLHYVGVCGKIKLLKIDLNNWGIDYSFFDVWNHPVFQYLRKTVNVENPNEICSFCKSKERINMRRNNPTEYFKQREESVKKFFEFFSIHYSVKNQIPGIEVLKENKYD